MPSKGEIAYWKGTSFYLNITNRCSNNCVFCVRNHQQGVFGFNLMLKREPTIEEIKEELQKKLTKDFNEVVFTGFGEPLIRLETVCNISRELKQKQEITIRIDTNGLAQLIHPEIAVIEKLREATVDELSISLNAENATKYLLICRPKFGLQAYDSVLDFAAKAKKYFKVTFTVVAIPQIDLEECFKTAEKLDIPLRTRHYHGPEIII